MLWTSVTSYPRERSQRRSHIASTNGREFPTWTRAYTVEPQTYMRIGPGGGGSSSSLRLSVL